MRTGEKFRRQRCLRSTPATSAWDTLQGGAGQMGARRLQVRSGPFGSKTPGQTRPWSCVYWNGSGLIRISRLALRLDLGQLQAHFDKGGENGKAVRQCD